MENYTLRLTFENGRNSIIENVCAATPLEAEDKATQIARGICDERGCDAEAEANVIDMQPITNLPELLDAMQCDAFDDRQMSALPTFGGPEPRDTTEIWSWDATHVIVGTHPGDYTIEKRDTK